MDKITVKRPWGAYVRLTHDEPSTVKLLFINKGEEFSLQYHTHRTEFWKILKGNPQIVVGEKKELAKEGVEFVINPNVNHRISAPVDDVVVLEISKGQFDEDDIVRIEDKYGRV